MQSTLTAGTEMFNHSVGLVQSLTFNQVYGTMELMLACQHRNTVSYCFEVEVEC